MTLVVKVERLGVAGRTLIDGLVLSVPPGTVHTLMGASGSG